MTSSAPPRRRVPAVSRAEVSILATCGLSGFVIFGSLAALNVAIPAIAADPSGGVHAASWMVVGFLMANSATILVFSKLSDKLGRRWFYLGGVVVFVVLSLVCATVASDEVLVVARVLQGMAAASAVSNSTAVISDVFDSARLPVALALHISLSSVASLIGPVIGGWLVDTYGWRAIFWATIPIGILALCVGWVGLRNVHAPPLRRFRFDLPGATLSTVGICLLLSGATQMGARTGISPMALALGGSGLIVLACFVLLERRLSEPLLDLRVISGPRVMMYLAAFCTSLGFGGVVVMVALYLQIVQGADATEAGLVLLPMGVAVLAAAALSGLLQRWMSARTLNVAGASTVGGCLFGLGYLFYVDASVGWICVVLVAIGFGEGIFMASIISRVMKGIPASRRAIANGFRSTLHNGALAMSAAFVITIVGTMAGAAAAGDQGDGANQTGFVGVAVALGICGLAGAVFAVFPRRRRRLAVTGTA